MDTFLTSGLRDSLPLQAAISALALIAATLPAPSFAQTQRSQSKDAAAPRKIEFFDASRRKLVYDHYSAQIRDGNCPLGFTKQSDGCVPPSQPRKWALGMPLPRDAIRFDVPPALAAKLGKPPAGHRSVRVGADILLITSSKALVVDSVHDLGWK